MTTIRMKQKKKMWFTMSIFVHHLGFRWCLFDIHVGMDLVTMYLSIFGNPASSDAGPSMEVAALANAIPRATANGLSVAMSSLLSILSGILAPARASAIMDFLLRAARAASSGVRPSRSDAFISAPPRMSISTMSVGPKSAFSSPNSRALYQRHLNAIAQYFLRM